ncbi:putative ABC transport system ATP-binding protein [Actinoplanes octamycinicus]|uniref:Putative ABC transport system ATP-binding protein n=1 Tax=Actinoplanes octamycinicus TaxID=135948 RepID=A0A7W7GUU5_9ACTN|nr:ABC transporter ATP-binding protein [Actinoplanes octamycinicus]MBB4738700.1 putative ABC transport system ATP-binding protein [Actinoplanes octamycinicus]
MTVAPEAPVIALAGASRVYPGVSPIVALRPTDLAVPRGDAVAITGRSGSGKSTLLQLLGLLDRPTEGQYWLNGVDTAAMTDRQRTRLRGSQIGFVFQSFHLIAHRTVEENVRLGLMYRGVPRSRRRSRALDALSRVGLADRADALPGELSGGQRQRVAIARALAIEPAVLLADEPTGNLDTHTAEDVLQLFDAIHRDGQTLVVVTHDQDVAARMPRRLTITDGLVVEELPREAGHVA